MMHDATAIDDTMIHDATAINDTMMYGDGNTSTKNGNMDDETDNMLRTTQIMDPDNANSSNETDNTTAPDNNAAVLSMSSIWIRLCFVLLLCMF